MLTTGGRLNPSAIVKVIWGLVLAGTASVLLLSGGLEAIQKAMLIAAFPFGILMILLAISFFKALKSEKYILNLEKTQRDTDPTNRSDRKTSIKGLKSRFTKLVAKNQEPELKDKEKD